MSAKRIFILNGHPAEISLNKSLASAYFKGAQSAGYDIRILNLHDLDFDIDFEFAGYKKHKPLEPDLDQFVENLSWAEHVILTTPMWWGGVPAKLKGLFDRALLPGFAFDTRKTKNGLPVPMLEGRTAHIIITSDTPKWYLTLFYKNAMIVQLKKQVFQFVGIKTTRITFIAGAGSFDEKKANIWLDKLTAFGKKAV